MVISLLQALGCAINGLYSPPPHHHPKLAWGQFHSQGHEASAESALLWALIRDGFTRGLVVVIDKLKLTHFY